MNSQALTGSGPRQPSIAHAILAGLCASLVGIGLARFAYTPLIPSLIEAHWFAANDVIYLGAANLIGYLAGALGTRQLTRWMSARQTLRLMMVLASVAFIACSVPLSLVWFFAWRFVSGVAGASIMVLAATTILPFVPSARKGLAGGAIFLGLGLGIAASGTLVPLLLDLGLHQTWIGLGLVSLLLTAVSWAGWPNSVVAAAPNSEAGPTQSSAALKLVYLQYALIAVGFVPGMVFMVDYVARGLGWGTHSAGTFWVIYGVGAIIGPIGYGLLADRIGYGAVIRLALGIQAVAVIPLVLGHSALTIAPAVLVIGTFAAGIVPMVLGRVQHLLPADLPAQRSAWSRATTVFALFQALAGYGFSYLFSLSKGDHRVLFMVGAGAFVLALAAELGLLAFNRTSTKTSREQGATRQT